MVGGGENMRIEKVRMVHSYNKDAELFHPLRNEKPPGWGFLKSWSQFFF